MLKIELQRSNISELTSFADDIRDGNVEKVNNSLDDVETKLLNTTLEVSLDLHTVKYVTIGPILPHCDVYEVPKRQYETVELTFTHFHLAIISRRPECVKLFLQKILETKTDRPQILFQILEKKVEINYGSLPRNLFDKDDRSLNGMNAIHLSARFDHMSLIEIMKVVNIHISEELALRLVNQHTTHLALTPLHLAVQRSLTISTR